MRQLSIRREELTLLAAFTMTLDHIGLCMDPTMSTTLCVVLRSAGRLAMPIYCFLLAEGFCRSTHRGRYLARLGLLALVSELPFDLMLFAPYCTPGGPVLSAGFDWSRFFQICWMSQSVMLTLLLAFCSMLALSWLDKPENLPAAFRLLGSLAVLEIGYLLGNFLAVDYGGAGVWFVLMFYLTRNLPGKTLWQAASFLPLAVLSGGATFPVGPVAVPMEVLGVFAMIPIGLYRGQTRFQSTAFRRCFRFFYPVHMAILVFVFFF